ncbi:unnamed protein product, partial [Macrosiphum euphorbiae]
MTIERFHLGVGVLNNRLYAVGGFANEMSECRQGVGVGVLDGLMYAIGGYNGRVYLKSVEVYRPSDGVWSSIADMNLCQCLPGVAVLDGL